LANDPDAEPTMKENMRAACDQLAGYQLSFWLPRGSIRKASMLVMGTVAVVGMAMFSPFWLLLLVPAAAFSPRVVAEVMVLRLHRTQNVR